MRVLYVNPMEGETNPAIDAISFGLQHSLGRAGIEMRTLYADFRDAGCIELTGEAIDAGVAAGVDGIAYLLARPRGDRPSRSPGPAPPGSPVFTFVRPLFDVNVAVLFPNFNHGVLMAEWLLPPAARDPPASGSSAGPTRPTTPKRSPGCCTRSAAPAPRW